MQRGVVLGSWSSTRGEEYQPPNSRRFPNGLVEAIQVPLHFTSLTFSPSLAICHSCFPVLQTSEIANASNRIGWKIGMFDGCYVVQLLGKSKLSVSVRLPLVILDTPMPRNWEVSLDNSSTSPRSGSLNVTAKVLSSSESIWPTKSTSTCPIMLKPSSAVLIVSAGASKGRSAVDCRFFTKY